MGSRLPANHQPISQSNLLWSCGNKRLLSVPVPVTREKDLDLEKHQTQRSVFVCKVIGPRGTGKTAFLQAFVGRNVVVRTLLWSLDVDGGWACAGFEASLSASTGQGNLQRCLLPLRHQHRPSGKPGEVPDRKIRPRCHANCSPLTPAKAPLSLPPQLNEVDVEAEFLKASDASCDVACLMYDSSDPHSFDYCASIYKVSGGRGV